VSLWPGPGDDLLTPDAEADRPTQYLEALLLVGVYVGRRDESVRLDEGLDDNRLAVRLPRGFAENEPLAGDRVLDDVSLADH
jgi:hypothetical protein